MDMHTCRSSRLRYVCITAELVERMSEIGNQNKQNKTIFPTNLGNMVPIYNSPALPSLPTQTLSYLRHSGAGISAAFLIDD